MPRSTVYLTCPAPVAGFHRVAVVMVFFIGEGLSSRLALLDLGGLGCRDELDVLKARGRGGRDRVVRSTRRLPTGMGLGRRDACDDVILAQAEGPRLGRIVVRLKLVGRQAWDAFGPKTMISPRGAESCMWKRSTKMVAGGDPHFYDVFALVEELADADAGAVLESGWP